MPFRNCVLLSSETAVRALSHLSIPVWMSACISFRLSALRNSTRSSFFLSSVDACSSAHSAELQFTNLRNTFAFNSKHNEPCAQQPVSSSAEL